MRIIKPLRLGLLTRPYTLRRQHRLGMSVLALATLDDPAVLLPEAQLWRLAGDWLEEDNVVDLAVPKPCAEFLVSGQAWAHGSESSGSAAVKARVAGQEKSLMVHGERLEGQAAPGRVAGVPVDWRHTYGGPGHEENPVGMGAARSDTGPWVLPQVEALSRRVTRPGEQGRAAGLGPVSPVRPRRFRRSGDYDPAWLENGFPGFPDTLDPHFFNAAEPDQWLLDQDALAPGSEYAIWNMHPDKPCLQGRLPHWQGRCFIQRQGQENLEEVALRLTTAWFFPSDERVLLMFHGAAPTLIDDASDVALIMPALDADAGQLRPLTHFQQVLKQRLAPDTGALHAFRDKDLLPAAALRDADFINVETLESPQAVNQRERARLVREDAHRKMTAAGHEPAAYELERSPPAGLRSLDELPDMARRMRRESRLAMVDMLRKRRQAEQKMAAAPQEAAAAGRAAVDAAQGGAPGGPPRFNSSVQARTMLAMAQDIDAERRAAAWGPRRVDAPADSLAQRNMQSPAQLRDMLDKGQQGLAQLYQGAAHLQASVQPAAGGRSVRMRRRVAALMQGSRDLSGLDLTGVDLSGMDLSGARCHGCWMEMADLSDVQLVSADLSGTVLTRARLLGAKLDGAVLNNTNLGGALVQNTSFRQARFEATLLDGAEFSACDFHEAELRQCAASDVSFTDCSFTKARLHTLTFMQGSRFAHSGFERATLERVVWLDCALDAVEYPQARLIACAWVQSQCLQPLRFEHAYLQTCCAVQTDMPDADFSRAWLKESSLRGVVLDGACFDGARLQCCDLSESSLREAGFRRCDAEGSLLMSCDLTGADLRESDLIDVIASKSDFRFADLGDANLFRADISQSLLDAGTRTSNAYVKWAKTLPAAPETTS